MDVYHFKGYGIPRFQEFFTHIVKPDEKPDEKQFHHVSDLVQIPKTSPVKLEEGMESDDFDEPGYVLYIPDVVSDVMRIPNDFVKQSYLETTVSQIVIQTSSTLKSDINLTDEIKSHAINIDIGGAWY